MKTLFCCLFVTVLINACNSPTSSNTGNGSLTATFTLADTTGKQGSQFHSGAEFLLSFTLTNTTHDTLTFHRGNSGPSITFHIFKNDSTVATSIDGYAFLEVVLGGYVAPGESLQGVWRAPTTPVQNPKVVLNLGTYSATVSFPSFDQAKVNPVSPIIFSITQ